MLNSGVSLFPFRKLAGLKHISFFEIQVEKRKNMDKYKERGICDVCLNLVKLEGTGRRDGHGRERVRAF